MEDERKELGNIFRWRQLGVHARWERGKRLFQVGEGGERNTWHFKGRQLRIMYWGTMGEYILYYFNELRPIL